MRRFLMAFVVLLASVSLVGSGAMLAGAAIPDSRDGTITACYSSSDGVLRVVDGERSGTDSDVNCPPDQTPLKWTMGFRWAGQWDDGPGAGKVAPGLTYPAGNKGKVVRMNVRRNMFGCDTPKGLWVSLNDSYSYPCTGTQNWQLLVPDPVAPETHWATVPATGDTVAASSEPVDLYRGTGYGYLKFSRVPDVKGCAITATLAEYEVGPLVISAQEQYGYVLYTTRKADGTWVSAPVSITLTCTKY